MPDFDESFYDAMSDEDLAACLAHDAELPLSFVRSAEAMLYAATVLAARQSELLPDAAQALERFKSDYLPVPFDGGTLWDSPPRFAPAQAAARPLPAAAKPRAAEPASAKPQPKTAKLKPAKPVKVNAPKPPLPPIPGAETSAKAVPVYIPAPAQPRKGPFSRSAAGVLTAALLVLTIGFGVLYIRTTMCAMIGSGPSPSTSAGHTLSWVPDGYTETAFTDWDVSGYLYTWYNGAGDKITFSRYPGGTNVAVDRENAETRIVAVCGVNGEYTLKDGERSLVFSDAGEGSVYYLDAKNVSDSNMQRMIAAIK